MVATASSRGSTLPKRHSEGPDILKTYHVVICAMLLGIIVVGTLMEQPWADRFVTLAYKDSESSRYTVGPEDSYVLTFWFLEFAILRFVVLTAAKSVARILGLKSPGKIFRFAEQTWVFLFHSVSFFCEVYLMHQDGYLFKTAHFWIGYPHHLLSAEAKTFYLAQTGFWLFALVEVHVGTRRKDHYQMVLHHIISIWLVSPSYFFTFTRIGSAVLANHDAFDILLPLTKMLHYAGQKFASEVLFLIMTVVYFITRHVLFIWIVWSLAIESRYYIPDVWDPTNHYYFNYPIHKMYLSLFAALQCLAIYWFSLILGLLYRVLTGKKASDVRSDSEGYVYFLPYPCNW